MENTMKKVGVIALVAVMTVCGIMSVGTTGVEAAAKPAKPKLSLKKDGRKITISWKKCKNAKKYEVWEQIKGKEWVKKKTTTSLKYSKTVSYDKQYYYRVRGLNGKTKGSYSSKKSVKIKKPEPKPEPQPKFQYNVGTTVDISMPGGAKINSVKITKAEAVGDVGTARYEGSDRFVLLTLQNGKIISNVRHGDYCEDIHNAGFEDGEQHAWTAGKSEGSTICYCLGAWEEGIKLYYTYDGTEPQVGQEDKMGDETGFISPQFARNVQVRGTVSYGEGIVKIGDHPSSWEVNYGNNAWTLWVKVYKNDQYIGTYYEHMEAQ